MSTLFQTPEWEEFKLKTGYQKSYRIDDILVLQKSLPLGWSMLYSPMLGESQISNLESQSYIEKIKEIAKQEKAIFYRAEFDIPTTFNFQLSTFNFIKAFEEMQPEHTLVLNISQSDDEILAQMKPKGRYNIKVAERSGVNIETSDSADEFYRLYQTMAKRQKITYRKKEYFQNLIDILRTKGYCQVFLAKAPSQIYKSDKSTNNPDDVIPAKAGIQEQQTTGSRIESGMTDNNEAMDGNTREPGPGGLIKPSVHNLCIKSVVVEGVGVVNNSTIQQFSNDLVLATAIVGYYGDRATYLFGGSSDKQRNLMAPYLLHWEIIKNAKKRGCKEYDFFGIAPDDNPKHAWAGVTRFKKQFGGRQIDLAGSYDLVFNKAKYRLFKLAEKIRRK